METNAFLLTGEYEDTQGGILLRFYGRSPEAGGVEIVIDSFRPVFFILRETRLPPFSFPVSRSEVGLKSFSGAEVDALYFRTQRELYEARDLLRQKRVMTFESDIHPCDRYLMERFIHGIVSLSGKPEKAGPRLTRFLNPVLKPAAGKDIPAVRIASIDIETDKPARDMFSIAVHVTGGDTPETKRVFMRGDRREERPELNLDLFPDEKTVFREFLAHFADADPDFIIGWHVVGFDLAFLDRRSKELGVPFTIGRGNRPLVMKKRKNGSDFALVPGRVVLDGPVAMRSAFYNFENFKLETVGQELLGEGKKIDHTKDKVEEINRMFREDKPKLAIYNLQDTVLVSKIFQKTKLVQLAQKRTQISGLLIDQIGSSTGAFDYIYLPRLHRKGYVAINTEDVIQGEHAAGGYVIPPKPGFYDNVVLLDFKSLYPSIIRTFKIDPLSRLKNEEVESVSTPRGFKFNRVEHILPGFIETLLKLREEAKKEKDAPLSQAIKILMNSFYGVMGSPGCRFYHPELPTAITSTGQWLLTESKTYIERRGYDVIYGDTDSLFVRLRGDADVSPEERGRKLAAELNVSWRERLRKEFSLESFMEIEYEKYYRKFLLPLARNKEGGAKKRYAGLAIENGRESLQFVGMEFVRSDWTRLAKDFQEELYRRIFGGEEWENWMRLFVKSVREGKQNGKLVYRKRLRKESEDYVKNVPPHVKAAKLLIDKNVREIEYIVTLRGPIPSEQEPQDIDYAHYVDKQLAPIADSVLALLGKSFEEYSGQSQLSLF